MKAVIYGNIRRTKFMTAMRRSFQIFIFAFSILCASSLFNSAHSKVLRLSVPPNPDKATQKFIDTLTGAPELKELGLSFNTEILRTPAQGLNAFELVKKGAIDFALLPAKWIPGIGEDRDLAFTSLLSQPTVFNDSDELFKVEDSVYGDVVAQEIGRKGVVVVTFWNRTSSSLVTRQKTDAIADLKGLKIRPISTQSETVLKAIGATPTTSAYHEAMSAKQVKSVDGAEVHFDSTDLSPMVGAWISAWKGGSFLANYQPHQGFLLVGESLWGNLTQRQRAVIQEISEKSTLAARNEVRQIENTFPKIANSYGLNYAKFPLLAQEHKDTYPFAFWWAGQSEADKAAFELLTKVKKQSVVGPDQQGTVPPKKKR